MKKYLLVPLLSGAFCIGTARSQNIYTIAGTGSAGFSGDGAPATAAMINIPSSATPDGSGNVYIADGLNYRIRKVSTSGIISTYAGNGTSGFYGDGGPATAAQFAEVFDLAFDAAGNMYVSDRANHRVRKITTSGIITTVAGDGTPASGGDGLQATAAQLYAPSGVAFDALGNMYITEVNGHKVRKVNTSGIISTIAGTGFAGFSGDGGAATAAMMNGPLGITVDPTGNVIVGEVSNHRVRKITPSGTISTIAGTSTAGSAGDGGPATAALMTNPGCVAYDAAGNLYITDGLSCKIRKVNTLGIISTYAGTGTCAYAGDGGPATAAQLNRPRTIAFGSDGSAYISDFLNNRVRKIPAPASTGITEFNDDGVSLFPNPANEQIVIVASPLMYRSFDIIDAMGKTVIHQPVAVENSTIGINHLPPGMYCVKLNRADGYAVRKFVKM